MVSEGIHPQQRHSVTVKDQDWPTVKGNRVARIYLVLLFSSQITIDIYNYTNIINTVIYGV